MSPEANATISLLEELASKIAREKLLTVYFDSATEVGGQTTLHFAANQWVGGGSTRLQFDYSLLQQAIVDTTGCYSTC